MAETILFTLVFDRTAADLAAGNPKGRYNAADLNRVGAAVAYLAGRLQAIGYDITISPRTDWAETDIPRRSEMNGYIGDLHAFKAIPTLPTIPPEIPQSAERLTIDGANAIERYLYNLGGAEASIRENYMYAGEIFAGEV